MPNLKVADHLKRKEFPFAMSLYRLSSIELHGHDFFEFFYVLKGKGVHTLDGKENIIREGDIVLMSPGKAHALKNIDGGELELYTCLFLPNLLESHSGLLKNMKGFMELLYLEPFTRGYDLLHLSGKTDIKVRIILDELFLEYSSNRKNNEVMIKILLADLLLTVVRFFETQSNALPVEKKALTKKAHAIIKSIDYIDEHFKEELTLDNVSLERTGITKEYFCSIFKKITGKTFTEYIVSLRIEHAAGLLQNTDKPVSEVCYASGFNDLSYFNRTFKSLKGVTPGNYRKSR